MKYSESHEWVATEGEVGTIGISTFAQKELGEIVYVELPEVGKTIKKGDEVAVLESTKAAADVYTPVSGIIVATNEALLEEPNLINSSPEDAGWIFKLKLSNPREMDGLMDQATYETSKG